MKSHLRRVIKSYLQGCMHVLPQMTNFTLKTVQLYSNTNICVNQTCDNAVWPLWRDRNYAIVTLLFTFCKIFWRERACGLPKTGEYLKCYNFNPNVSARSSEGVNFAAEASPKIFQYSPTLCTVASSAPVPLLALNSQLLWSVTTARNQMQAFPKVRSVLQYGGKLHARTAIEA